MPITANAGPATAAPTVKRPVFEEGHNLWIDAAGT